MEHVHYIHNSKTDNRGPCTTATKARPWPTTAAPACIYRSSFNPWIIQQLFVKDNTTTKGFCNSPKNRSFLTASWKAFASLLAQFLRRSNPFFFLVYSGTIGIIETSFERWSVRKNQWSNLVNQKNHCKQTKKTNWRTPVPGRWKDLR